MLSKATNRKEIEMRFGLELAKELHDYSSRMNRAKVCESVYRAMKAKGFDLCIVNDRAFQLCENGYGVGSVYFMRRNNRVDCWEYVKMR